MTPLDLSKEYLTIARDRRSTKGQRSPKYKRRIKGRKGIGKFAGLAAAQQMLVSTSAGGVRSTVSIDKQVLLNADKDLEQIPLPVEEVSVSEDEHGTLITLSSLSQNMSFPKEEAMRAALVHEYGREQGFTIYVNGSVLTVEDVFGPSKSDDRRLPLAGSSRLRFTIAEKPPKYPGIVLRSGGKVVGGKPMFLGLDEDPEIPPKLLKRVYGEVEVDSLEGHVTSDWGAVVENSELYADSAERYLLIEFKRPKHPIDRDDEAQVRSIVTSSHAISLAKQSTSWFWAASEHGSIPGTIHLTCAYSHIQTWSRRRGTNSNGFSRISRRTNRDGTRIALSPCTR